MTTRGKLLLVLGVAACLGIAARLPPAYTQKPDRSSLPIPDTRYKFPGKVPLDARDAKFPPIKELRPAKGAPNVVVILLSMLTLDSLRPSGRCIRPGLGEDRTMP